MALTIRKKRGSFSFRTRVPIDLQQRFGRKEIVRVIDTRKESTALRISAHMAQATEGVFVFVRNNPGLDVAQANRVLSTHIAIAADAHTIVAAGLDPTRQPSIEDIGTPAAASAYLSGCAKFFKNLPAAGAAGKGVAAELAAAMGLDPVSAASPEIQSAICDQYAAQARLIAAQINAANPSSPAFEPLVVNMAPGPKSAHLVISRLRPGDRIGDYLGDADIGAVLDIAVPATGTIDPADAARIRAFADQRVSLVPPMPAKVSPGPTTPFRSGQDSSIVDAKEPVFIAPPPIAETGNPEETPASTTPCQSEDPRPDVAAVHGAGNTANSAATAHHGSQGQFQNAGIPGLLPFQLHGTQFLGFGKPFDPFMIPPVDPATGEVAVAYTKKISESWKSFKDDKITTKQWTGPVADQSASTMKLLISYLGDLPVWQLTYAALHSFRTMFLRLPADYAKNTDWLDLARQKGLQAVADAYDDVVGAGCDDGRVTSKTWNRHLSVVEGLREFAWKALYGQAGAPPKTGLFIEQDKKPLSALTDEEIAERLYSDDQLLKLFLSPAFLAPERHPDGTLVKPGLYFGPLMFYYTGLRRGEVYQLRVRHIKFEENASEPLVYVDLKTDKKLKLKTKTSRRDVPLHRDLLALGFVEHLIANRNPDDMLFHDVAPKAKSHGDAPAKRFATATSDLDIGVERIKRFRATFVTRLYRAGVRDNFIQKIIGHSVQLINGHCLEDSENKIGVIDQHYNGGLLRLEMKQLIDRLPPPIDITRLPTYRGQGTP